MRCVALERRDLNGCEDRDRHERCRGGRHGERARYRWDPVGLIRQDDRMPMMIRRDELEVASVIHLVTMGRKASAQRPEDDQQEARHQLMRSCSSHEAGIIVDVRGGVKQARAAPPWLD